MRFRTLPSKRQGWFPGVALSVILSISLPVAACAGALSRAADPEPSATAVDAGAPRPAPAPAAMKAYIDPATGQLVSAPEDVQDAEPMATLRSHTHTSEAAWVEQPAPGGGMKLDLDETFLSYSTATKDRDGKLSISHAPLPASK